MTRFELKNLILECIDEKMDDIVEKIVEKNKKRVISDDNQYIIDIRKDVNHIGRHLKLSLPSDDSPF